jgi:hypothetical protein
MLGLDHSRCRVNTFTWGLHRIEIGKKIDTFFSLQENTKAESKNFINITDSYYQVIYNFASHTII